MAVRRQDVRQLALGGLGLNPTQGWLAQLGYLYPPGAEDGITPITHWVCIDPDTQACTCTLHPSRLRFSMLSLSVQLYQAVNLSLLPDCSQASCLGTKHSDSAAQQLVLPAS